MAYENLLKGSCLNMCPTEEMTWRERNKLLHILEIIPGTEADPKADLDRTIKKFSRSAAGKLQSSYSDLRPSNILLKTMNYLINNIVPLNTISWIEIYNFVNDRIQGIRQDITIQMIEDMNSVLIYEKCVRFYIMSSYFLCEETQYKFDQFLNKQQLCICLEKLIELYQKFQSQYMNEMISIHFSLNVDNFEKIYRYEVLFKEFFKNDLVKLTVRTCLSWMEGNFVRFFLCVEKLPIILQIIFFHHFGLIRKRALKILCVAYNSQSCQVPIAVLAKWLCLSTSEALSVCETFKIKVIDKNVCFNKKDFFSDGTLSLKKEALIEKALKNTNKASLINGETRKRV